MRDDHSVIGHAGSHAVISDDDSTVGSGHSYSHAHDDDGDDLDDLGSALGEAMARHLGAGPTLILAAVFVLVFVLVAASR